MLPSLTSRALDDAPPSEGLDSVERPGAGEPTRPVRMQRVLLVIGILAVAAVHFRPWQGGMLEDWGLADAWNSEGLGGFPPRLQGTLGRPFHLVPHYIGMVLSDGGVVGPYAVLAAVAVGQFVAAMWALRPLVSAWGTRWSLALLLAVHPWWVSGDILRFMPAQVAVLGGVIWLGASIRYLRTERGSWLGPAAAAVVLGLLTYQGPALAFVMASVALGASEAKLRCGARLVVVTTAAVGAVLVWSTLIAPRIAPDSYESQLMSGATIEPVASVHAVLRTLVLHGEAVVILQGAVMIAVTALGLHARLRPWQVWALLGLAAAAPSSALIYASNTLHLNDPERVVLPVGVVLWMIACCVADRLSDAAAIRRGVLAVLLVATVLGGLAGYLRWTAYSSEQNSLITAVETVRRGVPDDATVLVEDTTGRYGDVYLLLPPHLNFALDVEYGVGADAVLCTASGVQRNQPTAALYPIATTPDCAQYLSSPGAVYAGEAMTDLGLVRFHVIRDKV